MSLQFDGVDDVVTGPAITVGAQISVVAWIRATSLGTSAAPRVYEHGPFATPRTHLEIIATSKLRFGAGWSTTAGNWETADLTLGFAYTVGVSYDHGLLANDPAVYLNGVAASIVETSTPAGTAEADGGAFYVGNRSNAIRAFAGPIAEFALWTRILTAGEFLVVNRYGPRGSNAAPAVWWRMGGSAANAFDFSGNGRHGTVTGATLSSEGPIYPARTIWPVLAEIIPRRAATDVEWLISIGTSTHVGTRDAIVPLDCLNAAESLVKPGMWNDPSRAFDAAILDEPSVDSALTNTWYGYTDISRGSVTLRNEDGRYDALWPTAQGQTVIHWRYDRGTGYIRREYEGIVDSVTLTTDPVPAVIVAYVNQDLAAFDTKIPRRVASTDLFGATCPSVGEPLPFIVGTVPRMPLIYVKDDVPGAAFDYVVGEGVYDITAVYRNRENGTQLQALTAPEYTVETTRYAGLTTIRVGVRQLKSNGGFHDLFADVVAVAVNARNPARLYQRIVANSTWALGLPVDLSSTDTAAALVPAEVRCDGVIREQSEAREYLSEILSLIGGSPVFSVERGWGLRVDAPSAASQMALGDGPGLSERNLLRVGHRTTPDLTQAVKTLVLKYSPDQRRDGKYEYETSSRTVGTVGRDLTLKRNFLRDRTAADRAACYLAKAYGLAADTVESAETTEEGRYLVQGDIVTVTVERLQLAAAARRIVAITKGLGRQQFTHRPYSAGTYTYEAGTLPALKTDDDTITAPTAPTTPSLLDQTLTAALFGWTRPAEPGAESYGYNWDLRTAANGGGSVVLSGYTAGTTLMLSAYSVGYGSARHFRVQPVKPTGTPGAFTSSVSVTFARAVTNDIENNAVTPVKRDAVLVVSIPYTGLAPQTGTAGDITHGAGRTILATLETGNDSCLGWVVSQGINTIRVGVLNLQPLGGLTISGTFVVRYF